MKRTITLLVLYFVFNFNTALSSPCDTIIFTFESSFTGWSGDFYRTNYDPYEGSYAFRSPDGESAYETRADSVFFMTGTMIGWFKSSGWDADIHPGLEDTDGTGENIKFVINPDGTDNPHYRLVVCDTAVGEPTTCPIPHRTWFKAMIKVANSGTVYVDATPYGYSMSIYAPDCICSTKQPVIHAWNSIWVDSIAIIIDRLAPISLRDSVLNFYSPVGEADTNITMFFNPGCTDANIDSVIVSPPFFFLEADSGVAADDSGMIAFYFSPDEPGNFVDTAYIYYDSLAGCPVRLILAGTAELVCTTIVDSVWFSEETNCDDSNIVEICYSLNSDCPDSLYNIDVRMSLDSGSSWVSAGSLWFSTLYDTSGDLGIVHPGIHCFYWVLSSDTSIEMRNAMISVKLRSISETTFVYWVPYVFTHSDCPSGVWNQVRIWGVYPNTNVRVDFDHDGVVDTSFALNPGDFDTLYYPDIAPGTKITANKPIEVDYFFRCSDDYIYEDGSMLYSIYPTSLIGTDYVVGGDHYFILTGDSTLIFAIEDSTVVYVDSDYSGSVDSTFVLNTGEYGILSIFFPAAHIYTNGKPIYILKYAHSHTFFERTYSYLLLPIDKLDTIYYAPKVHPYHLDVLSRNSYVVTLAVEESTSITMNGSTTYPAGPGSATSLTTEIPIVVISSKKVAAMYISNVPGIDHWTSVEREYAYAFHLFPEKYLSTRYVLPPTGPVLPHGAPKIQYSIISFTPDNLVEIDVSDDGTVDTSFTLDAGEIAYLTESYSPINSNFFSVNASAPVQITKSYRRWWEGFSETTRGEIICSGPATAVEGTTAYAEGPLDSENPDVNLLCPDTFFTIGDTVALSWNIEDLFWNGLPCSLTVNYCGRETSFVVNDTLFAFEIPDYAAGCDSVNIILAARDSFCNWGYDSCTIPIVTCAPAVAWLVCPPEGPAITTSCSNQSVTFAVVDTSGFPIDTTRIFVHREIHGIPHLIPSDSLILRYLGDTLFIEVPGDYLSSDTVSIYLDSVFNILGCPTEF